MDIVIARIQYPNDPTGNLLPHQHFVSFLNGDRLDLYTVSSILGKEYRLRGSHRDDYEIINAAEIIDCGFKVPSFIDCTKCYSIHLDGVVVVEKLNHWDIAGYIVERIQSRISRKIIEGNHTTYQIALSDLKRWNKKL